MGRGGMGRGEMERMERDGRESGREGETMRERVWERENRSETMRKSKTH